MEHYYVEKPQCKLRVKRVIFELKNGRKYIFDTPSGVFSFGAIDKATKILIEHALIKGKKVLDLGCGYGVIGIVLKGEYPDLEVYMSDINERAVEFSKVNAKNNNVEVHIKKGAFFEPWGDEIFDVILLNPPIVAGKQVVLRMISEAKEHLNPGGLFEVVAYHNKGGSYIKKAMQEIFGNVQDLYKEGGIRIYLSRKE
ncbi:class I SAM-dependent methyltransferase [Pseudothermotoga thermarum]|uniref:16S rRNA m(2)G 1207 methyltransferase n=1 Tax=Pseudothermotoga thermarum DSM 5069 TaxID=688269 RepID=F7YWJ1_9THEM|nr:methyltransferase [Pseudothermotoga thermarum]AEH51972.1 16S rRNA m(2)G 1207 methyltransferase [Pseudothermotoga thermarum DSM 5069]